MNTQLSTSFVLAPGTGSGVGMGKENWVRACDVSQWGSWEKSRAIGEELMKVTADKARGHSQPPAEQTQAQEAQAL